jgi:hypothetical protein
MCQSFGTELDRINYVALRFIAKACAEELYYRRVAYQAPSPKKESKDLPNNAIFSFTSQHYT